MILAIALGYLHFQQPQLTEVKDVVFTKVAGEELKLDITAVKSDKPLPVLMLVHGGGWIGGSRTDMAGLAPGLAQVGFACVSVDYRLAPKAKYPAQLEDVKASVRWIKENASKYGFDKTKIAAFGVSAGGHLTSMLAATSNETSWDKGFKESSSVNAVVSYAGPTDLPTAWKHRDTQPAADKAVVDECLPALIGDTYEKMPDKYKDASPLSHVTKKTAPILFLHGNIDTLVLQEQSELMYKMLQSQGIPTELVVMPKVGHGGFGDEATQKMVIEHFQAFLKNNLK
jgi:acetyl esterase/lipase